MSISVSGISEVLFLGRPRKGCPPPITPLQVTMHIQRRDYDRIVYSRDHPNQPFHEILHKILAKLDNLEEEVKGMRLELDEYRHFIKAKGLEEELSKVYDSEQPPKEEETNKGEYLGVVNRYPSWDV